MRASELMSTIPGITMDHLHNWERQGYLAPSRMRVGKKQIRDYNNKEVHLIKAMWLYYQKGLSPKNAYRSAAEELAKGPVSPFPPSNAYRADHETQGRETDSLEAIAIFELAIPLRHYFHVNMSGRESGWILQS